jgi:hypothetical protein
MGGGTGNEACARQGNPDGDAAVDERPSAKPGTGTLVIAAVSGGADSVFLLHVLHALVARMPFTLAR